LALSSLLLALSACATVSEVEPPPKRAPHESSFVYLGLAGGLNSSSSNSPLTSAAAGTMLRGFSYSGLASLTFLQDAPLGVQAAADYTSMSLVSGGGAQTSSTILSGSIIPRFNIDWSGAHHSLGVGYAWARTQTASDNNGINLPSRMTGYVVDGKDMFALGKKHYGFLEGRVFIWNATYLPLTVTLLMGFDF
jgi:hypothetical protein